MSTTNYSDEEDANDVDVVIVGGGLTGLTTAYNILRRKPSLTVLIIEGTDEAVMSYPDYRIETYVLRAGGRVLSQGCSDYYYASLLQNHVTRLLQALNIEVCSKQDFNTQRKLFFTKHGPVDELPTCIAAEVRYFLRVIQENCLNSRFKSYMNDEITRELATTSVDQLLKELSFLSYARSVCTSLVYATCGMRDLRKLSALWTLVMLNGAGGLINRLKVTIGDDSRYFVKGGMTLITEELLKGIRIENGDIIYGEPVTKIQFNDDRAYCYTTQNCYKCDIVVIAVPPPEASCIRIEPPLPEHICRSQTLYTQSDNRFFNTFYEESFWNNEYSGDVLATPDSGTILNVAYDATCDNSGQGIIAGFLNDTNVIPTTSKLSLFDTLSRCFRNNEAKRWMNYKEYGRKLDEDIDIKLTSGWPMSVMQPCHVSNHVDHINASTDRTLFAASEYATKWPGTIDGAIETGELTACLVLLKVRPQVLNFTDMVTISNEVAMQNSFPIEIAIMQYFCLAMNIVIFFSLWYDS